MPIFKVGILDELRNDDGDFLAGEILVLLIF